MKGNTKNITEHGISMYRRRGCRCEVCKAAMAAQRTVYRPKSDNSKLKLDARVLYDMLKKENRLFVVESDVMARWMRKGINVYSADKIAVKLGYHPYEIWGDSFYEGCNNA